MKLNDLCNLLQGTQSVTTGTRVEAENTLLQFIVSSQDAVHDLLLFTESQDFPLDLRQLSIVLVCRQISNIPWSFSDVYKNKILQSSFRCFLSREPCIHNSSMVLIGKILSHPDVEIEVVNQVFTTIIIYINQNDLHIRTRSCRCLSVMAEEVDSDNLIRFWSHFSPVLAHVFSTSSHNESKILRYTAKTVRICLNKIGDNLIADEADEETESNMLATVGPWVSLLTKWINDDIHSRPQSTLQSVLEEKDMSLLMEIFGILTVCMDMYPSSCSEHFGTVMSCAWTFLIQLRSMLSNSTKLESDENLEGYTSDGDRIDVPNLFMQTIDLLRVTLISEDRQAKAVLQGDLTPLLTILTEFVQLPQEQLQQWVANPNEFVASEQDETYDHSLRAGASTLMLELFTKQPTKVFTAVLTILQRTINEIEAQEGQLGRDLELRLESLLFLLGRLVRPYTIYVDRLRRGDRLRKAGAELLETVPPSVLLSLCTNMVSRCLDGVSVHGVVQYPLVFGRSLWLFALISKFSEASVRQAVAVRCLPALEAEQNPLATRLQVLRGLSDIVYKDCETQSTGYGSSFRSRVIAASHSLSQRTDDCTAHFPIEMVAALLKGSWANTISQTDCLLVCDMTDNVWRKYPYDPLFCDVTDILLQSLVKLSSGVGATAFLQYCAVHGPDMLSAMLSGNRLSDMPLQRFAALLRTICLLESLPKQLQWACASKAFEVLIAVLQTMLTKIHSIGSSCMADSVSRNGLRALLTAGMNEVVEVLSKRHSEGVSGRLWPLLTDSSSVAHISRILYDALVTSFAEPWEAEGAEVICGLLVHWFIAFSGAGSVSDNGSAALLSIALNHCRSAGIPLVRDTLLVSCCHLMARDAHLCCRILTGNGELSNVTVAWLALHNRLRARHGTSSRGSYNETVSVAGAFALATVSWERETMSLVLAALLSLPQVLLLEAEMEMCTEAADDTGVDLSDGSGEDAPDFLQAQSDSEDEFGDEDGGDGGGKDPFAPAELYLSDVLATSLSTDDNQFVADSLVFRTFHLDPLLHGDGGVHGLMSRLLKRLAATRFPDRPIVTAEAFVESVHACLSLPLPAEVLAAIHSLMDT